MLFLLIAGARPPKSVGKFGLSGYAYTVPFPNGKKEGERWKSGRSAEVSKREKRWKKREIHGRKREKEGKRWKFPSSVFGSRIMEIPKNSQDANAEMSEILEIIRNLHLSPLAKEGKEGKCKLGKRKIKREIKWEKMEISGKRLK